MHHARKLARGKAWRLQRPKMAPPPSSISLAIVLLCLPLLPLHCSLEATAPPPRPQPEAAGQLGPYRLVVDRRACSEQQALFVEPGERLEVEWGYRCNNGTEEGRGCRGTRPLLSAARRLTLTDESAGLSVHSSSGHEARSVPAGLLRPDREYLLTLDVSGSSVSCRVHTALERSADWPGADWIGGGTQLRSTFTVRSAPTRATLYASGLGCFSLSLNGASVSGASPHSVGSTLMDPGWSTIPNMRLLYTAYNVSSKLRPGDNVLGVRLGFCHYGYIDQAFCISGHAERDSCRAFLMVLSLTYEDGTTHNITSTPARFAATTAANPMTYSHLYHGETIDARMVEDGWDSDPSFTLSRKWHPATVYTPSTAYEGPRNGELTLMTMPPMGVAEELRAISIKKLQLLPQNAGRLLTYYKSDRTKPMVEVKGGYFGTVAPTPNVSSEEVCKQLCAKDRQCVQVTWRVASGGPLQQCESYSAVNGTLERTNPAAVRGWVFPSTTTCPAGPTAAKGVKYPTGCTWFVADGQKHFMNAKCNLPPSAFPCAGPCPCPCIHGMDIQFVESSELAAIPVGSNFTCDLMSGCGSPFPNNVTQHIFDFGQNFAGSTKLTIKAPKGTRVLIRHSEFLQSCGDVIPQQCPIVGPGATSPTCGAAMQEGGWPCLPDSRGPVSLDQSQGGNQANQTSLFITNGSGVEVFSPSFSYYGFRYAAISGLPEGFQPDKTTLTALRVNTLAESHGGVKFSSATPNGRTLNRIQNAVRYTFQSNLHSHPEDCPQRERHGWTADSQVSSAAQMLNFDLVNFYANWHQTMEDVQVLGCDVKTDEQERRGTVSADALTKGLPTTPTTPVGKARPPWFSCASVWAPSGNASGAISDVVPFGGWG